MANVVPYFLFAWAEQQVPSHVAGALNATTPLFTLGIAIAVGQEERATSSRVVGLLLGFAGASRCSPPGGVACLAAAASYGWSYVYMRRYLTGRGLPPLVLAAGQLTAGSALLVPLTPLLADAFSLTPTVLASVAALGALGTGAAYVLNYRLIQDEGATTASTVSYLLTVVAVVLGVLVLREPVTWNLLAGSAVVLIVNGRRVVDDPDPQLVSGRQHGLQPPGQGSGPGRRCGSGTAGTQCTFIDRTEQRPPFVVGGDSPPGSASHVAADDGLADDLARARLTERRPSHR
ncbi:MAG: DMT family transporter [Egibacteraceae bacterium]